MQESQARNIPEGVTPISIAQTVGKQLLVTDPFSTLQGLIVALSPSEMRSKRKYSHVAGNPTWQAFVQKSLPSKDEKTIASTILRKSWQQLANLTGAQQETLTVYHLSIHARELLQKAYADDSLDAKARVFLEIIRADRKK